MNYNNQYNVPSAPAYQHLTLNTGSHNGLATNWMPLFVRRDTISALLMLTVPLFKVGALVFFYMYIYKQIKSLDIRVFQAVYGISIMTTVLTCFVLLCNFLSISALQNFFLQSPLIFMLILVLSLGELAANLDILLQVIKKQIPDKEEQSLYKGGIIYNITVCCLCIVMSGYLSLFAFSDLMVEDTQRVVAYTQQQH